MSTDPLPDWRLPTGVSRGLWDYVNDRELARKYDANLADCTLLTVDQAFAEKWFTPTGRLLDLGCGTGRTLVSFADQQTFLLGVDLSLEMLRVAREKTHTHRDRVSLLQANLVELACLADQSFDSVACLFSTLGMISGVAHRKQVLAHAYRVLKPGGRLVVHVHNRWFNFWSPGGRRWLLRSLLGRATGSDVTMPVHQGIAGLSLHVFTRTELVTLLREVGFRILDIQPISLRSDGVLPWPGWFGWLRAYGYLCAGERPRH